MSANTSTASNNTDIDQLIKRAMKLLHSSHSNSATELRLMLEEAIKQRHPDKMYSSTVRQRFIEDEANFPGRAVTPPIQSIADEIINLTNSPDKTMSDSPATIQDSDDEATGGSNAAVAIINTSEVDDGNLKEFGDLNCCVCGEMVFTASNRLIECSKCGTLYHQECHKPTITEEEASEDHEHNWQCDTCCNKPTTSKVAGIMTMAHDEPMPIASKVKPSVASSHSSSSSNSSSPFYKPEHNTTPSGITSGSSGKHINKGSSSAPNKLHKEERSSSSKSASVTTTSTIYTNSSEKHTPAKRGSSSAHTSNKTSSSSTKSTKHQESGSSKRRSHK